MFSDIQDLFHQSFTKRSANFCLPIFNGCYRVKMFGNVKSNYCENVKRYKMANTLTSQQ